MTIVPRSPDWLFAYFRNANGGPTVLRVHDATVHDVDVPDGAIHAFVPVTPDTSGVRVEMGVRERSGEFTAIARSNPVDTPPTRATTTVDPQWPIDPRAEEVHARALRALGGASSRMESEVSLPTSPAPPFPGASKRLNVGAGSPTESGRAVPSTEGGAGQRARDFFLEVGTDLIVHGATVPGSTVTIRGERVMLRTDGTFSIRMALPDGVHDFEVRATSPDGIETRVVDLRVTRELRARKGR
ncbi:MAG: DUF4912 domain-containing protein [Planctomycetes bacterium]|nr:DUF4912 domain-containing protein [Planctomycetota bacterium]